MALFDGLLGSLFSGNSNQGMAGMSMKPQSVGQQIDPFLGKGGTPGSIRPSVVGMPGYQQDVLSHLQSIGKVGTNPLTPQQQSVAENPVQQLETMNTPPVDKSSQVPLAPSYMEPGGTLKSSEIQNMIRTQVANSGTKVPVSYFDKMARTESGCNPKAKSPTGAKGLFQFIGSTWKAYGGSADPLDPVANTNAAIKFADDNYNTLSSKLGRPPNEAELYMAHNLGPYGASRLLSADPNQPVTAALINSNPAHNPKFLTDKGRTITARQAILKYSKEFGV